MPTGYKITLEEARQEFIKRGYIPLFNEYKNNKILLQYQCLKHPERELYMSLNALKSGDQCPYCTRKAMPTLEEVKQEFIKRGYTPLFNEYKGAHIPLSYQCPEHPDKELKMNLVNLRVGHKCPYCSNRASLTTEEVKQQFINRGYIPLFDEYKNTKQFLSYKCLRHPNENLKIKYCHFRIERGCSLCYEEDKEFQSKSCKLIEKLLIDKKINYKKEYMFENCKNINKLRFDFAIFNDNNELQYLIEYDGTQHYRPWGDPNNNKYQLKLKDLQRNDQIKNNYCKQNNIRLYRIPYWESKNIDTILNNIINDDNYLDFTV